MRHRLRVNQLEHAPIAVGPLDVARTVVVVVQQLQQKLPQVSDAAIAVLLVLVKLGRSRRR